MSPNDSDRAAQATPAEGAEGWRCEACGAENERAVGRMRKCARCGTRVLATIVYDDDAQTMHVERDPMPPAPTDGADVGEADVRRYCNLFFGALGRGGTATPGWLETGLRAVLVADRATRPHPSAPSDGSASAPSEAPPDPLARFDDGAFRELVTRIRNGAMPADALRMVLEQAPAPGA